MTPGPLATTEPTGDWLVGLVVVVTLVALVLGTVVTVRSQRDRREAAAAWAQARAWDHHRDGGDLHTRWRGQPFATGRDRTSERVLRGRHAGRDVVCLDFRYDYTSGSGARGDRHVRTSRWAVVATTRSRASPEHGAQLQEPALRDLLDRRPHHVWRLDGDDLLLLREGELDLATLDEDVALSAAVLDALHPRA